MTQEPTIILQGITVDELMKKLATSTRTETKTEETNLTVSEVAEYLRVHPNTIYKLKSEGKIPFKSIRGKIVFPKSGIDKWLQEN